MTPEPQSEALSVSDRERVADTLETLADTLAASEDHRESGELHVIADDLRIKHLGTWEAVFEHDDGRYLHLGHAPDEAAAQAIATTWATGFGGRLDWHNPWPDGTRQADYIPNGDPGQDRGTGIEIRPAGLAERRRRFDTHQRATTIRLRDERDAATMRLARIGDGHTRHVTTGGMTSGDCIECDRPWPCATNIWATTTRDLLACWDPAYDEPDPGDTDPPAHYDVTIELKPTADRWTGTIRSIGLTVHVDRHDEVEQAVQAALAADGRNPTTPLVITYI